MFELSVTEQERQLALDSIALVRLAIKNRPPEENDAVVKFILSNKSPLEVEGLVFRLADLSATLLDSWRQSMIELVPEEYLSEIMSQEQLLDTLVRAIVASPTTGEDTSTDEDTTD